jgi:signal transduction histidine kinase
MIETPTASSTGSLGTAAPPRAQAPPLRVGSLRRRLPLVISLFLVVIVGAGGTLSYLAVRDSVLVAARSRLQNNARQWSRVLALGIVQRNEEARRAAARPALQQRLGTADPAAVEAARRDLQTLLTMAPPSLSVELWSAQGARLEAAFANAGADGPGFAPDASFTPPRAAGARPLQIRGDILYSELVAEVTRPGAAGAAPLKGFLVFRRRVASPTGGQAVQRLIGDGYAIRAGSRESGVWTDLGRRVEAPPHTADAEVVTYRPAGGPPRLGTEVSIAGIPWSLFVETPESVALAPASAFLNRMLPIGVTFVVLGALLAWIISRRITTPLHELTGAAEAIAGGDLTRRVRADRTDEVGRLAYAFNTMSDQVQAGYSRLDAGIRERTAELEQALVALRETQEQLIRREKLAMLGQLASGVGHELRNPLGVMTNAVYYLDMVQPDAPADVREYHGILRAQIGMSEKIIGDLLDFSRVRPPRRDAVAIRELVAAQQARLSVPPGVAVRVEIGDDVPVLHVDAGQIGQVVYNLLVNAVQVVEGRGGTVTVSCSTDAERLRLHVHDDGPGVPPELRGKIFEPLFTTKARGIGLGLAVSRSLAENNGGALTLDDTPTGARFTLALPRHAAAEAP